MVQLLGPQDVRVHVEHGLPGPGAGIEDEAEVTVGVLGGQGAEIIAETENAFAIRDIAPQAPVHLLVIPKSQEYHTPSLASARRRRPGRCPRCGARLTSARGGR
jgi:hypothetical protein